VECDESVVSDGLFNGSPKDLWQKLHAIDPVRAAQIHKGESLPGKSHRQRSLAGYTSWSERVRHDLASKQQACIY